MQQKSGRESSDLFTQSIRSDFIRLYFTATAYAYGKFLIFVNHPISAYRHVTFKVEVCLACDLCVSGVLATETSRVITNSYRGIRGRSVQTLRAEAVSVGQLIAFLRYYLQPYIRTQSARKEKFSNSITLTAL